MLCSTPRIVFLRVNNVFRFDFVCSVFWVEFEHYRGGGGAGGRGGGLFGCNYD